MLRDHVLKIISPRKTGKDDESVSSHSHSYILLYNWSVRSTESYHGHKIQHQEVNLKELEETIHKRKVEGGVLRGGGNMHNPTVCLLSSSSFWDLSHPVSLRHEPLLRCFRRGHSEPVWCPSTCTPHWPAVSTQRYFYWSPAVWETRCVTFLVKQTRGGEEGERAINSLLTFKKRHDMVLMESYAEWQNPRSFCAVVVQWPLKTRG